MSNTIHFPQIGPEDDAYDVTLDLADRMRETINTLSAEQDKAGVPFGGSPNFVLAALTVVWLEAVHTAWNSMSGESAIQLLRGIDASSPEAKSDVANSAQDLLRRSGWKEKQHAPN